MYQDGCEMLIFLLSASIFTVLRVSEVRIFEEKKERNLEKPEKELNVN